MRTSVIARAKPDGAIRHHHLPAKIASCALSACLLMHQPVQAAQMRTLADVMRPTFEFVDSNKDGVISMDEIKQLSQQV